MIIPLNTFSPKLFKVDLGRKKTERVALIVKLGIRRANKTRNPALTEKVIKREEKRLKKVLQMGEIQVTVLLSSKHVRSDQ